MARFACEMCPLSELTSACGAGSAGVSGPRRSRHTLLRGPGLYAWRASTALCLRLLQFERRACVLSSGGCVTVPTLEGC